MISLSKISIEVTEAKMLEFIRYEVICELCKNTNLKKV